MRSKRMQRTGSGPRTMTVALGTWVGGGLGLAACPAVDDTETTGAGATGTATDPVATMGGSADGPDSTATQGDGSGDSGGPPPLGTCCTMCPDDAAPGASCGGADVPPPCCTATTLLICGDVQCGSQSCVGTWQASTCDCEARTQYYGYLLAQANQCDPTAGDEACVSSPDLVDACGCAALVDSTSPALDAAATTQQAWMDAGCGPIGCGAPCIADVPLQCATDENSGIARCVPAPG